jgi:hypothetical protein
VIERTFKGVNPHPTITAPMAPVDQWHYYTDEALRQASFQQSSETRDGKVAPFPTQLATQH